jgi:hypothetical protein
VPTDGASVFHPRFSLVSVGEDRYPALTYRRLAGGSGTTGVDYTARGLTYTVEYDEDLVPDWTSGSVAAHGDPASVASGVEEVTVRATDTVQSGNARFLRLRVAPE